MPNPIRTTPSVAAAAANQAAESSFDKGVKPAKPSRTGYNYVARMSSDAGHQQAQSALARIARGKEPRTIIVNTEAEKRRLQAAIHANWDVGLAGYQRQQFLHSRRLGAMLESPSAEKREWALRCEAAYGASLRDPKIKSVEADGALASLDPATTKLYVVGHGAAGGEGLSFKQGSGEKRIKVLFKDLAIELAKRGLPADYQDVRANTCRGADVPQGDAKCRTAPAGQTFADAMGKAGFRDVKITAYPGRLMVEPFLVEDGKLHRAVDIGTKDSPSFKRASTNKQVFASETSPGPTQGMERPDPTTNPRSIDDGRRRPDPPTRSRSIDDRYRRFDPPTNPRSIDGGRWRPDPPTNPRSNGDGRRRPDPPTDANPTRRTPVDNGEST